MLAMYVAGDTPYFDFATFGGGAIERARWINNWDWIWNCNLAKAYNVATHVPASYQR
jgi:hypothetical protein